METATSPARKQSPGSCSRGVKHMWHADGTRRPCCLCPVGHLSKILSPWPGSSWETTQEQQHFQIPGPGTALVVTRSTSGPSQSLTYNYSQQAWWKREGNILNLVVFFLALCMREEVSTAWRSRCLKITTAARLQPSPPAALLLNRQHITRRRPEETHWHSIAALLLLFRGTWGEETTTLLLEAR